MAESMTEDRWQSTHRLKSGAATWPPDPKPHL